MKIQTLFKKMLCWALIMTNLGCAAMINGTTQTMAIRSNHEDAKLYVNEEYIGTGNAVSVLRKKDKYVVTARKEGCEPASQQLTKSFDWTTLLGILIDYGIVSVLIIDGLATGAWQKFNQTGMLVDPVC